MGDIEGTRDEGTIKEKRKIDLDAYEQQAKRRIEERSRKRLNEETGGPSVKVMASDDGAVRM